MKYDKEFPTSVGVELSYIDKQKMPVDKTKHRYKIAVQRSRKLEALSNTMIAAFPMYNVHRDGNCVEVSSPAFVNSRDIRDFFLSVDIKFRKAGLFSRYIYNWKGEEIHVPNGGGHIHCRLPRGLTKEELDLFKRNTVADILNHPFLNWMFQEWMNGCTGSESLEHRFKITDKADRVSLTKTFDDMFLAGYRGVPVCNRDTEESFRGRIPTMEYRMFQSHQNWEEFSLAIDFVLAHYEYILEQTKKGTRIELNEKAMLTKTRDESTLYGMATNYFAKLGLKFVNYNSFLTNYRLRRDYGKL